MTNNFTNAKLAIADGWKWNAECDLNGQAFPECWTHDDHPMIFHAHNLPAYLNDHLAINRLVSKQSAEIQIAYIHHLLGDKPHEDVIDMQLKENARMYFLSSSEILDLTLIPALDKANALAHVLNLW